MWWRNPLSYGRVAEKALHKQGEDGFADDPGKHYRFCVYNKIGDAHERIEEFTGRVKCYHFNPAICSSLMTLKRNVTEDLKRYRNLTQGSKNSTGERAEEHSASAEAHAGDRVILSKTEDRDDSASADFADRDHEASRETGDGGGHKKTSTTTYHIDNSPQENLVLALEKLAEAQRLEWYIKLFLGVHFADNLA